VTFELFATPYEGDFFGLAETLARHQLAGLFDVADRAAAQGDEAPVTRGFSRSQLETLSTGVWSPSLGGLRHSLSTVSQAGQLSAARAQAILSAYLFGLTPSMILDAPAHAVLFVGGESIAPRGGRVEGAGGELRIEVRDGEGVRRFRRLGEDGAEPIWLNAETGRPVRLGGGARAVRATCDWMRLVMTESEADAADSLRGDEDDVLAMVERATSFLETGAPAYYVWTSALLREVVPLREYERGTRSTSFVNWPGHIHLSKAPLIPSVIALIHECSHQYFHLAQWCGRVTTPDAPLVHSVLKERPRPLEKILLGFHAFANVLLALAALEPAMDASLRAERDRLMDHHLGLAQGLDAGIRSHWEAHLTQSGKDLYLPLRKRLADAALL